MNYNRVLKMADYEAFEVETRKEWEVHLALMTLRDLGVTSPDAMILGVGAAVEDTIFYLANPFDSRFVIATDLYLDMGDWSGWAGEDFMKYPGKFTNNIGCEPWQIIPRHADMRALPFPDGSMDGIFSSGSIEHVGQAGIADYDAIATAAAEIGRVLRPGGVASLSTEWKISGDGWGWSHVRLFDEETIMEHIVTPSGLELVDELDTAFDGDLDHVMSLSEYVAGRVSERGYGLITDHDFVFTSVHLALRKPFPDDYIKPKPETSFGTIKKP